MIEKCSIGNISYNIQNITLIILMLILIIVIIYYLKNSGAKHSEIIEKYTTPSTTNVNVDNSDYGSHDSIATSQLHNFPTSGTEVTLRPCQVQFNNTFDDSGTGTHRYVYEDGWQEIATLKTLSDTSPQPIKNKVISANNETNKDDKNNSGEDIFTNYSEQSKCFKKISGTDNKYKYKNNDLIKYHTDKYVELVELKDGVSGSPDKYMQMEFDLEASNSLQYYNNLKESICSLKYADTVPELSGNLIRLTLNANNIITDIKRVTVDSTNNHIFNIDPTFNISSLITIGNSGKYRYNTSSPASYEYVTTNSASSGLIINIDLYKFDRNLLCDNTSGATTYQNIKTYTKLSNAKIRINSIVNINLPPASTILNTTLPTRYNTNNTITGDSLDKDTLIANIDTLIDSELVSVNGGANSQISVLNGEKTALINTRNTFIDRIPSLQTFIDNAIIKSNYDNVTGLKYNSLLNSANYDLKVKKVEYTSLNLGEDDATINLSVSEEPTIKEVLTSGETDVYETRIFNGTGTFELYDNTICDILIVGGGGGGGFDGGGGGGGGQVLYYTDNNVSFKSGNSVSLNAGTYNINIGNGGIGGTSITTNGNDGGLTYISNNNTNSSSTPSIIPSATDKTKYVEYLAQLKTGVGGWRIVRYLPPTSRTSWYPVNDNLSGTLTIGNAYSYDNFWTVPFGTFDEFVFGTFNMNYWLQVSKEQAVGTNYTNSSRTIIKSSISNSPYNANWYNRGSGAPEDPWIGLRSHGAGGGNVNNPEKGGDLILYGEGSFGHGHWSLPSIYKDGGMCVFVRQSTKGIIYSAVGGGGGGSRNNTGNSSNGGGSGGNGHANGEANIVSISGGAGGTNGGGGHNTGGGGGGGGANISDGLKNGKNSQRDIKAGDGGSGVDINISGINIGYGGGGGGGSYATVGGNATHGGGKGNVNNSTGAPQAGIDNTGGGGGSGGNGGWYPRGEKGGSGVVMIRYKTGIKQSADSKKISLKYENISGTRIFNSDNTFSLHNSTKADILVVGGGGGGSAGGGGGGGYNYITGRTLLAGTYTVKVGAGGTAVANPYIRGNDGEDSFISFNNVDIARAYKGGGGANNTGLATAPNGIYGSTGGCGHDSWAKNNTFPAGTLVGGNIGAVSTIGTRRTGGYQTAGGGGGAGGVGQVGIDGDVNKANTGALGGAGGIGLQNSISGTATYYAGGGAGGTNINLGSNTQVNRPQGGLGGGGNGNRIDRESGTNGTPNTGGGGGGSDWENSATTSGGSGIVIVKFYDTPKLYKLRVPVRTMVQFKTDNQIHYTGILEGTYKITMRSTNIKIEVYPGVSGTKINIDDITINLNKMDIIYNLKKSTDDINSTDITATSPTVIDIYNNTISYTHTHYYRYKISSHISKTYKVTNSGVDSVNFNMYLYSNTGMLIPSANYSIRYHYPNTDAKNVIIPIHIFITIKPMPSNATYTGFKIITYSSRANGLDETQIYAFIGKKDGTDTSIASFNSILDVKISLAEKDVWGIEAKQREINTQNEKLINRSNINDIICNVSQLQDHICNIKTLISITNSIKNASFTSTTPSMIENVPITSTDLFPMSTLSPILNYSITDYISYESSTKKAPANRITTFNILDNASKYVYFSIPSAST
jgi:hypothetical protein